MGNLFNRLVEGFSFLPPRLIFFMLLVPLFAFQTHSQFVSFFPFFCWLFFMGESTARRLNKKYNRLLYLCLVCAGLSFIAYDLRSFSPIDFNEFWTVASPVGLIIIIIAFVIVSNNIVKAEESLGIKSYKEFITVLMLWFFPLGLWSVQKRINRIAKTINEKRIE